MNNIILINFVRFILLLLAQIIVFNNIGLFGFLNPYPYMLYLLIYPINSNRAGFLISSFLLGLVLDFFDNSGGVHATSCLILAYIRPYYFKFFFGLSYEYQTIHIDGKLTTAKFSFILIAILTHHFIMFQLEYFNLYFILESLKRTLITTVFSLIIIYLLIYLFKPIRK